MKSMEDLVLAFPNQLREALSQTERTTLNPFVSAPEQILICGMGGSGIAGHFIEEVVAVDLKIPILLHKGYELPAYCSKKTLLILSSYSGNTEEVFSIALSAVEKGIPFIVISSGGKLIQIAEDNKLPSLQIPTGFPPRSYLGYSIVWLLYVLNQHNIIGDDWKNLIKNAADFLDQHQENIKLFSDLNTNKLLGKTVFAIGELGYQSALLRFQQQLNENAKVLCHYSLIPEMNHNELVGWRVNSHNILPVFFLSGDEHPRNRERILFTANHIRTVYPDLLTITAKGSNSLERRLYLIHLGDYLSCCLSRLQGYDPIEIDILVKLKKHMSDIPNNS